MFGQVPAPQPFDPEFALNPDRTTLTGRLTLAFCFLAALCEGLDVQAAGVTAGGISQQFHPSPSALGFFFSASSLGLILGALIGGRLSDRIGRKAVLIGSIGLFGLFSLLTSLAGDMSTLTWARALTGLGLGGAMPNLIALAAEASESKSRNTSIALTYIGMPLGGSIASLLVLVLPTEAWRMVFRTGGIAPLLIVPFMLRFMPSSPGPAAPAGEVPGQRDPVRILLGQGRWRTTLLLWLGFFLIVLTLHLMLNWLPLLLVGRGLTKAQAALAQVGFNAGGGVAALLIGSRLDTRWQRPAIALTLFTMPVMLGAIAAAPPSIWLQFGFVLLLGGSILGSQVIAYGVAGAFYPAAERGTGVGTAVATGRVGSLVGPLFAAALVGAGRTPAQVLFGVLPIVLVGCLAIARLGWRGLPRPGGSRLRPPDPA